MTSWRESIVDALSALGGEGAYDEIYAEVAARRDFLPPTWQAIIRRTIQQSSSDSAAFEGRNEDLFYSAAGLGKGRWGLRRATSTDVGWEGTAENPGSDQGYVADSVVRRAIEQHAVAMAIDHYSSLGATDVTEVGKPYDLRMLLGGTEVHVEVKGSTRMLGYVTLTRNEVTHARETPGTQLFVADEIGLLTGVDGAVTTTGGRIRVWGAWAPTAESLTPTVFQHRLNTSSSRIFNARPQAVSLEHPRQPAQTTAALFSDIGARAGKDPIHKA